MREALHEAGRDPAGLRIVGGLAAVRRDDRSIDLEATMEAVPGLVAAGVTDLRPRLALPEDPGAAEELARAAVVAFRTAVGRPLHD
jgi:hypothetical protein